MLCCGAGPNLRYWLDKPWFCPYTATYQIRYSENWALYKFMLTTVHATDSVKVSWSLHCSSWTFASKAHENPAGPPNQINPLIHWQLLYVHYEFVALSHRCCSDVCCCSFHKSLILRFITPHISIRAEQIMLFWHLVLILCFFTFRPSSRNDDSAFMSVKQPLICIGLCLFCMYYVAWQFCSLYKPLRLQVRVTVRRPILASTWRCGRQRTEGCRVAGKSCLFPWASNARTVVVSLGRGRAWTPIADTAFPSVHPVLIPWTPSPCHWPNEEIRTRGLFAYMTP